LQNHPWIQTAADKQNKELLPGKVFEGKARCERPFHAYKLKFGMCRNTILALWGFFAAAQIAGATEAAALWTSKVQPLLDVNCVKCHGPLQQKSGLELDNIGTLMKGGDDGAVIVPGKPQESRLYQNLASDAEQHMPPKKQLSEADRKTVREWIASVTSADLNPAPVTRAPRHFESVTEAIDTLIAEGWQERKIKPAAPVDDRTWCRRVYLDLAGRICTSAELQAFLNAPETSKRTALVDRLLASDEYPVRMRELWDVFLMGRPKRERTEDQRKKNGWWAFLENGFRTNRPWDEMVHAILLARSTKQEDKGASWFIYERRDDDQAIAEAIAPLVYGTKINCAQCHNHPLAREIKQAHYWGLVAAYNRCKNVEGGSDVAESAVGGFVNFTNLKKESQPAIVTLLSGGTVKEDRPAADQKEDDAGDKYVDPKAKVRVPKFSRRAAFADAATRNNPLLARAFVNRTWSAFLGRGIVQPADEMNSRNAPSHPELLDWLAQDFAAHQYDVRREVKGIVLSRVYALGTADVPPESFASAIERPLSAEQLARSWRIAAGLPPEDDALRRATITALPDLLPKDYNATYQQAQFLANSSLLAGILKPEPASTMTRLAALPDPAARVREAFLAAYARLPDADERGQAKAFLKARSNHPVEADRDLLWAMMTSAEFLTVP
jgi:mono/diheme cytochrome c family protein